MDAFQATCLGRYGVTVAMTRWLGEDFPYGTLAVNALGSLLLGFLAHVLLHHPSVPPSWRLPLTTGFLGAFTTFSTFSVETVKLLDAGHHGAAASNVLANLALGLALVTLGGGDPVFAFGWLSAASTLLALLVMGFPVRFGEPIEARLAGRVRALRPARPLAAGHVVVEPCEPVASLLEADAALVADLLEAVKQVAAEIVASRSARARTLPNCQVFAPCSCTFR